MCMMCPDAVDCCYECSEARDPGNPRKLKRGWLVIFFLDSKTWCVHLTVKHGTDSPHHYAHFAWGDHEGDGCDCRTGNWFDGRPDPIVESDDDD